MATTTPSTALVPVAPMFTNTERLALAGFLAGYSGLTRQAYELDLRQFAGWCQQHQLQLFGARRADIELFATRKPTAEPGPPSPAAYAPSPGSTGTPSKKNSSSTHPLRVSAVPGWIMSPTPPGWTVTNSARS